jgi:hypothetical protein
LDQSRQRDRRAPQRSLIRQVQTSSPRAGGRQGFRRNQTRRWKEVSRSKPVRPRLPPRIFRAQPDIEARVTIIPATRGPQRPVPRKAACRSAAFRSSYSDRHGTSPRRLGQAPKELYAEWHIRRTAGVQSPCRR